MTKPIAEYQYLVTCPECGGVSNSYSERILHPAELDREQPQEAAE